MNLGIFSLLILAISSFAQILVGQSNYLRRSDLDEVLSRLICGKSPKNMQRFLWSQGIHDADINIVKISKKSRSASWSEVIEPLAIEEMQRSYHRGYSFGTCGPDIGWIVSVPSSFSILRSRKDQLSLPKASILNLCREIEGRFIPQEGGSSHKFIIDKSLISLRSFKAGTISVSCKAREPEWMGPKLLFMFPTFPDLSLKVPKGDLLASKSTNLSNFETWVNSVRRQEGLKELRFDDPNLQLGANHLSKRKSIVHDRFEMAKTRRYLLQNGIHAIGENRVAAKTLLDLAWLIWFSPSHRDLILDPSAKYSGLALSENHQSKFLVMITGKRNSRI